MAIAAKQTKEQIEKSQKTKVVAVIPAYNVQSTVRKVVKEAQKIVDEVLVVNDGSSDNTYQLLVGMNVRIVNHTKNQGLGCALRRGFEVALKEGYDIVVTLDSDGQHDARDIKKVIAKLIEDKADAVIGSRLLDKNQWRKFPKQRLLGNRILTFLTNLTAGGKVTTDSQSGFRALEADCLKKLNLQSKKMAIASEIIFELAKQEAKIVEVPIKATYDKEISNVKAISDISLILWLLLKKRLSSRYYHLQIFKSVPP